MGSLGVRCCTASVLTAQGIKRDIKTIAASSDSKVLSKYTVWAVLTCALWGWSSADAQELELSTSGQTTSDQTTSDQVQGEAVCDVVEVLPSGIPAADWLSVTTVQYRGEVKQLDGVELQMIDTVGEAVRVPSHRVVRVEPRWRNATAAQTHQLFVQRRYRELSTAVPAALESDLERWQQRLLIAELVQGAEALGSPRVAGIYFLSLAESNPPPLLYSVMPLCWTAREPDQALRAAAEDWLKSDVEAARLLGASWLLMGESQLAAQRELTRLQASSNRTLAEIAVAQGWRLIPPPQTMSQLSAWLEFRDKLTGPLQLGPTELLSDRLMRIGRNDLALGQWGRIASQHADHPHRAAVALDAAGNQLRRMGKDQEAQRLETWKSELGLMAAQAPSEP